MTNVACACCYEREEDMRQIESEKRESKGMGTMVENRKKHRQNSHLTIHCPTSEGVSEVSERANE